jgi:hypothetical protein
MKESVTATLTALPIAIIATVAFSNPAMAEMSIPWSIETGLGYDSNPYRTPGSSYIDYAQTGNPLVNPSVQSGFFLPVNAKAILSDEGQPESNFNSQYKLNMTKYLESGLKNADEYSHVFTLGKTLNKSEKVSAKSNNLYGEFELGINRKTYFERDDGTAKTTTGGSNISDRYNYLSYGFNIDYDARSGNIPYTVTAGVEQLDYDDPIGTTALDHTRLNLGIASEIRLSQSNTFKYAYEYANRSYSDRHARDSAGVITTQLLEYDYHAIDLTLRNRLNDNLVVYFDYRYKQRNDGNVGYNDSTTNTFKIRNIYKTSNTRTRLALSYYTIDYANAFNYENPAQGDKSSDAFKIDVKNEFSYRGYQLWVALEVKDKNSTDLRYQYDRYQASVGISLEL